MEVFTDMRLTGVCATLLGAMLFGCSGGGGGGTAGPPLDPPAISVEFEKRHAASATIRVLAVTLDYADDDALPFSRPLVQSMLDGVTARIENESNFATTMVADIVEVVMPQSTSHYSYSMDLPLRIRRDALAAAGFGFAVPEAYDRVAFLGKRVWTQPFPAFQVGHVFFMSELNDQLFVHELMHTYGRPHTGSFDPAADSPNDSTRPYGDEADYMGEIPIAALAIKPKSMHAKSRHELGWAHDTQVLRLDQETLPYSGTITLQALESSTGLLAMVLPTASGDWRYWVQYRGQQPHVDGAVISLTGIGESDEIRLLDPTPGTSAHTWRDAYLALNVPFVTPEGITLEMIQLVPGVSATIIVHLPSASDLATDQPPVLGVAQPTADDDVVSGTTVFEVSAYDPDLVADPDQPEHFEGIHSLRLDVLGTDDHGDPVVLWTQTITNPTDRFVMDTSVLWDNVYDFRFTAIPTSGVSRSVATHYFIVNGPTGLAFLHVADMPHPIWANGCDHEH